MLLWTGCFFQGAFREEAVQDAVIVKQYNSFGIQCCGLYWESLKYSCPFIILILYLEICPEVVIQNVGDVICRKASNLPKNKIENYQNSQ